MKKILSFTMAIAFLMGILPVVHVSAATLAVTSPKAGDVWQSGQTHTISWNQSDGSSAAGSSTVGISLAPPRPACLDSTPACLMPEVQPYTISTSASNTGSFNWTVPENLSSLFQGSQQITVSLNDGSALGRSEIFTIGSASNPSSINVSTTSSLSGTFGQSFTATFSASGGTAPYAWSVTEGSLPPGLSLEVLATDKTSDCAQPLDNTNFICGSIQNTIWLTGIPTQSGSYQFQLTASDQNKKIGSARFTVNINSGKPTPCPASNGIVFKYSDSPAVYVMENGMKRPYPSGPIFLSWNQSFSAIVVISRDCQFPDGALVRFADGKLVKGSGPTVYLISQGTLRAFPSAAVFFRLGYSFNQIILASDGDLSLHTAGSMMQ